MSTAIPVKRRYPETIPTDFLLSAIKKDYPNPEFEQEQKRQKAAEARKDEQRRNAQKKQLEEKLEDLKKARDNALDEAYDAIAEASPDVLKAALSSILVGHNFYRQSYEPHKTPLENYQERLMFKNAFRPYLERHAPKRIQAVQTQYATEIAALEEQIAALQPV